MVLVGLLIGAGLFAGGIAAAQSAPPQPFVTSPPASIPAWGDPYQLNSAANAGVAPAVGIFGNGGFLNGPIFGGSQGYTATAPYIVDDPYYLGNAQPPGLNAPIVDMPPTMQSGMLGGSFMGNLGQRLDSRFYFRAEYLLWDTSGMGTPPLVTTSPAGTPQDIAGVLGEPGTSVLFGGGKINGGATSGFMTRSGMWFTKEQRASLESEFFWVGGQDDGYTGYSDGSVILARPFFDIDSGQETAQLLSYPDIVSGSVNVQSDSELMSYLLSGRFALCPPTGTCCQPCGARERTDWLIGYRYLKLEDSLQINESLQSELTSAPGSVALTDNFRTKNQFNGLQLGVIHVEPLQRGWFESALRVALGNNKQTLNINGNTTYTESGVTDTYPGGLYAQRTNSGSFTRDQFVFVPELRLRLGLRVTDRFHFTIGYSALYLPNVIRAGEQIDTDINPGLIPEESDPLTGALRPQVQWIQSDYIAHGLNLGGELQF
ncbi:BBP7 family outer membrane beta-barrel protein [Stieleria tagensis]|uniref:BBP7 family outer membrane beta-barrel protein n=1 Tax=Stieleria tagensis TaxID=2956795 RepID=UPI00209B6C26|nr:BBP7 family outer membrane beta-barrel protein [Stieleria tagensis]